ncbi:MAG: serine/threonine-protein kinase [Verrucomicrobiota bacterium]|nr:serine/threonine-protein kinase [Verrucomicrobiota bacterium]
MPPDQAERVLEVVTAALELDPKERAAFLDQACAGDAELRAEAESLLGQEKHVRHFIEEPPTAVAAKALEATADEAFVSRQLGAYKTICEIGRGGLGTVYLAARADDAYEKEVALKLLRRGLDTDDILRRFRKERQILARLEHPNIARLIDGGTSEDGLPYFVMEYVPGEPFTTYAERSGLTTKERLQLFRTVCAAVAYAHQHLIIHRDLKPSNILVTAEGEVKLLDFGIAKVLGADDEAAFQTMTQLRVMTPEYASPEQVRGGNITTASDVYSLGVVLYELLTGAKPYRLTGHNPKELESAITEQEPERPSAAVASNQQSLRGDLDNIVLMALRKEPARRYASVAQFSDDLHRHLEGLPVLARKGTVRYRAVKFIQRHRLGVAAALFIFLSLLAGIIATERQARAARRESAKAEAISTFLQKILNSSSPSFNTRAGETTVKDVLDEASRRLATIALSTQPEVRAELQRIIGTSYLDIGEYDRAEQNLTAALAVQVRLFGEDSLECLKTSSMLAALWAGVQGKYVKAEQFYKQKLPLLRAEQKRGRISASELATALNGAALLRRAQGHSREAELLLREELQLAPQLPPDFVGVADSVLALTLTDQGKFDPAIRMMRTKVALLRRQPSGENVSLAGSLTALGSFLMQSG